MSSNLGVAGSVFVVLLSVPGIGAAQQRIFPDVPSFERPEASPRVHGIAARLLSVRRGDSRFGQEPEAEVALGENFPVVAIRGGANPITLGLGTQVYARFSLHDKKSALISNDWVVGINSTAGFGAWAFILEAYHESSHLGDEYEDRFGAKRLDWTRDIVGAWVSYSLGRWRVMGSGNWAFQDELELGRAGGSFGIDFRPPRKGKGNIRPVGGLYLDANAATEWRVSSSLKVGVGVRASPGSREIGLAIIAHDGLSTQRQFFQNESRYVGVEVRFDL